MHLKNGTKRGKLKRFDKELRKYRVNEKQDKRVVKFIGFKAETPV